MYSTEGKIEPLKRSEKTEAKNEPSYVQILRYYQKIQAEVVILCHVIVKAKEFLGVLNTEYGLSLKNSINTFEFNEEFQKLDSMLQKLYEQLRDLNDYLNPGNLRNVVHSLYTEKGLTAEKFAVEIGYTEQDITELTLNGIVSDDLLSEICRYFKIEKTSDFKKYLS